MNERKFFYSSSIVIFLINVTAVSTSVGRNIWIHTQTPTVMIYSTEFQSAWNKIWSDYISLPCFTYYSAMPNWLQELRRVVTCNFGWIKGKVGVEHTLNILYSHKLVYVQLLKSSFKKSRSLCFSLTFIIIIIVVSCEQLFPLLKLLYKFKHSIKLPTHLSNFFQKIVNAARSKWRFTRESSITCTAQRSTLGTKFISSYLIWNAQTERKQSTEMFH
jgi:hypothetical protein